VIDIEVIELIWVDRDDGLYIPKSVGYYTSLHKHMNNTTHQFTNRYNQIDFSITDQQSFIMKKGTIVTLKGNFKGRTPVGEYIGKTSTHNVIRINGLLISYPIRTVTLEEMK
jgi:hypothetical protein